jgi:hypothetical protein
MRTIWLIMILCFWTIHVWARKVIPDTLLMDLSVTEVAISAGATNYLIGSSITIYQHGVEIGSVDSSESGKFSIALVLLDTGVYTLVAYKPGYIPKRILIKPSVDLTKGTGRKYGLHIDFVLFQMRLGEDYQFWRQPVSNVYFKNQKEGFVLDEIYEAYMQVKIKDELIRIGKYHPEQGKLEH